MNIDELLSYGKRHFGKNSVNNVDDNINLISFSSPITKNWFALLSLDPKNERLNINCGSISSTIKDLPGFSSPSLIKSKNWVDVSLQLSEQKIKKTLEYAFKLALMTNEKHNLEKMIYIPDSPKLAQEKVYHEQKIDFSSWKEKKDTVRSHSTNEAEMHNQFIPEQIQKMMKSYQYSLDGKSRKEKNFYHQGKMMADYEDNYEKRLSFLRYYPTYHDLTVGQARTYFTWRSNVRKNNYEKVSDSYAYIYLYELLNKIGVANAEEGLQQLITFNENYAKKFSLEMSAYIERWIRDYIIFNNLNIENNSIFKKEREKDRHYEHLLYPNKFSEHEVAESLEKLSKYKIKNCPMYKKSSKKFEHILVLVWKKILNLRQDGFDFFSSYIAYKNRITVQMFSAAVFNHDLNPKKVKYEVDLIRRYLYDPEQKLWYCEAYWGLAGQKSIVGNLLHEVDREIRQSFNLGRNLKARKIEPHYLQAIKDGIREYELEERQAKLPKINFSHLSTIREDAAITRDNLLTEEELKAEREETIVNESIDMNTKSDDYGLTKIEEKIVRMLLEGENPSDYIKKQHLMLEILVDSINEKIFDEIGDNVIEFVNEVPRIVEDYQEDLIEMFLKRKD